MTHKGTLVSTGGPSLGRERGAARAQVNHTPHMRRYTRICALHSSLIVGDDVHALIAAHRHGVIGVEASAISVAIGESTVG